jgi:hypothetical protein
MLIFFGEKESLLALGAGDLAHLAVRIELAQVENE